MSSTQPDRPGRRDESIRRLLAVARGDEPADLLFVNARVVNVLTGEVEPAAVAVAEGRIAGLGPWYRGREVVDLGGRFLAPGLIEAHVHLESSLLRPREFARHLAARGVTTAVMNPHEIANVCGAPGVRYLLEESEGAPADLLVTLPSCVPATDLATSGAELGLPELRELRGRPQVVGLGEVMDVAGAVTGARRILDEMALFPGGVVDGHAPGVSGPTLNAYAALGPATDHECSDPGEAREKLRRGMTVLIREGSAARNLEALLPLVTERTERRMALCTDDLSPANLAGRGGVDHALRRAIALGVEPLTALRLATLNPAEIYGLRDRGAVAPGRKADLIVLQDLGAPVADAVYHCGRLVAREGRPLEPGTGLPPIPPEVLGTVRVAWDRVDLAVPARGRTIRAIRAVPGQIVTGQARVEARVVGGLAAADPDRDLAKLAVIERHQGSGRVGLGFVCGTGLRRGALASTVAHDHHNLIVLGADDASMLTAARAVAETGGGMAVAAGDAVLARLPLPVAGLLSDRPLEEVVRCENALNRAARELGVTLPEPFWALSFFGLEVVPELKLTDRGLVDVARMRIVPLFPEEGR